MPLTCGAPARRSRRTRSRRPTRPGPSPRRRGGQTAADSLTAGQSLHPLLTHTTAPRQTSPKWPLPSAACSPSSPSPDAARASRLTAALLKLKRTKRSLPGSFCRGRALRKRREAARRPPRPPAAEHVARAALLASLPAFSLAHCPLVGASAAARLPPPPPGSGPGTGPTPPVCIVFFFLLKRLRRVGAGAKRSEWCWVPAL